jgi:hypothetical protein
MILTRFELREIYVRDIAIITIVSLIILAISCGSGNSSVEHFSKSIDLRNQAARIQNAGDAYETVSSDEMETIIELFRKALVEAKLADIKSMNKHYPDFGNHFNDEFIRGLELILEGYDKNEPMKHLEGQILEEKWGTWYENNFDAIRRR